MSKTKKIKMASRPLHFWTTLLYVSSALVSVPDIALANPQGGSVVSGGADIGSRGNTLTVTQYTDKAIINWNSFDINAGETTRFNQPSSQAITLNRVTNSGQVSTIRGALEANGQVIIVNPNGVLIGPTGRVDTAGFIATTANLSNQQFNASNGRYVFDQAGKRDAVVENQGSITISPYTDCTKFMRTPSPVEARLSASTSPTAGLLFHTFPRS